MERENKSIAGKSRFLDLGRTDTTVESPKKRAYEPLDNSGQLPFSF